MKLSKSLAVKLLQLAKGGRIPASMLNYPLIAELLAEGIIADSRSGRAKSVLHVPRAQHLSAFLLNRFSIHDLEVYIDTLNREDLSRAILVQSAADSKVKKVRTFKGFLVNSYLPVGAVLNGEPMVVHPPKGTFQFIHDFENFVPDADVTIVGIENAESFSQIYRQQHLFGELRTLFVSRYPQGQSKDLIKWLQHIPNPYVHFGDFDFAGVAIYLQEYKRYLGARASFFIPDDLEASLAKLGSKKLYDVQIMKFNIQDIEEPGIVALIELMHKYKRGLEQEALIL